MDFVVFGTAGHIDHGKSALVLALSGTDPDRLKEEKARGITIDLGFAHFDAGGLTIALVDVPGHERFVKNMLAGASGIDYVLLVVAADESVMPQTREHFDICRLLGVSAGVIALTKVDLVDDETLELVRMEVRDLVKGSPLEEAPIVAVSARTGAGVPALVEAMVSVAREAPRRAGRGTEPGEAARLPIDRVFTVKGFGTVVTGTLASGTVVEDDLLVLLPSGRDVKVRGIQVHGRPRARAYAGERTAVNLAGVDLSDVERGENLVSPGAYAASRRFDAVLRLLPDARPLKHGARVRVHQGTSEVLGRVALAGRRETGVDQEALSTLTPGEVAYVRVRLERSAVLARHDRFVIRAYSPPVTIGGGVVLDPEPPRRATRTAAGRRRFERLDPERRGGPLDACAVIIEEAGAFGLPSTALLRRAAVAPGALDEVVNGLVASGMAVRAGDSLVAPRVLDHLRDRLLADLAAHHRKEPMSEGVPREELRERLFRRANAAVFSQVVADLVAEGRVVARDAVALAGHRATLSVEEARASELIETTLRRAGLKPPDVATLGASVGLSAGAVTRAVAWLVRRRTVVRLDTLLFHAEALEALKQEIAGLKATAEGPLRLDVATFKDRYGITRKYAIPLLEFLDRERVTRRVGESRIVL